MQQAINNRVEADQKPIKVKILNKHFMAVWWSEGTPRIEPNVFEMTKQWCLLNAQGVRLDLPYFPYSPDWRLEGDFPSLFAWWNALGFQNTPSKINFRANPARFRELVEPLDFSKPFCQATAEAISAEFTNAAVKQIVFDCHDVANAELDI